MATITTRAGKGSPLENDEIDDNFTNLNTDKLETSGGTVAGSLTVTGTVTAATYTGALASAVTATTQPVSDNSTKVATTAYVDTSSAAHDSLAEVLAVGNTTSGTDVSITSGDSIVGAGDINITGSISCFQLNMDGNIVNVDNTSNKVLSAGTAAGEGANLLMYGGAEATTPFDIRFRLDATNALHYDHSATTWNFQANDITTTGNIAATDLTLTGGIVMDADDQLIMTAHTGGAATALASADNLVLDGSTTTNVGMTILTADSGSSRFRFGSPSDVSASFIGHTASTSTFSLGTTTSGGNVLIYSGNALTAATIDSSADWDFQANDITTTGTLDSGAATVTGNLTVSGIIQDTNNTGGMVVSGGTSSNVGANITLYGGAHATTASDYQFKSDSTDVLYYNYSASLWDFQANDIVTTGTLTVQLATIGLGGGAVSSNMALGYRTLFSNTTGSDLVAIGRDALYSNTVGANNIAIGYNTLGSNQSGASNIAIGSLSLDAATGSQNTALGVSAGTNVTTGSNLTLVGYNAQPSAVDATNEMTFGDTNVALNRFNGDVTLSEGAVSITDTANEIALQINSSATTSNIVELNGGSQTTGGHILSVYNNGTSTGTKSLQRVKNNSSSATGTTLVELAQNAAQRALYIDQNGDGIALVIDSEATTAQVIDVYAPTTAFVVRATNQHASAPYGLGLTYTATPNDTASWFIHCVDGTAARFQVRSNGGIANFQSNDADLSDQRIKTELVPLDSTWNKIKAIEVGSYRYLDQNKDTADNIGIIAQQVLKVAPELVEVPEDKDEMLRVYNKDLYFTMLKTLQEAMDRIEKLEAATN